MKLKKFLKKIIPQKIINYYFKLNWVLLRIKNKNRSVSQVFSDVYLKNRWGGERGVFYSGTGSEKIYVNKYCDMLNDFVRSLKKDGPRIRMVDLGCGDFRVGDKILKNGVDYLGVDIVPELVEINENKYGGTGAKFICLDIISEELPDGDICLIRQVLQHLSNQEIIKILQKLKKYKYIFITESHPVNIKSYNKDKIHGPDMRLSNGSGVYLDKPPFDIFNVDDINLILSVPYKANEKIETFLIKNI